MGGVGGAHAHKKETGIKAEKEKETQKVKNDTIKQMFSEHGLGTPGSPLRLFRRSTLDQNYFHSNTKTVYAFFILIISKNVQWSPDCTRHVMTSSPEWLMEYVLMYSCVF